MGLLDQVSSNMGLPADDIRREVLIFKTFQGMTNVLKDVLFLDKGACSSVRITRSSNHEYLLIIQTTNASLKLFLDKMISTQL